MFERLLFISADFNALDAEGRVRASLRFAATADVPSVGEWVQLADGEKNSCLARIMAIEGLAVVAEADWSTWIPGEVARLSRSFTGAMRMGEIGDEPVTEGAVPHVTGRLQAAA